MPELEDDSSFLNDKALETRLAHCQDLPSPPGVAIRILELGQDPAANLAKVAEAVSLDPALAAKILRIANSPIYARQRKTDNLRQAIMMFGLNGTLTLALSFSLVNSLRNKTDDGLDYNLYWRRALAAFRKKRQPIVDDKAVVITASFGVAIQGEGDHFESTAAFVRAADRALYAAKLGGRDQVVFYHKDLG